MSGSVFSSLRIQAIRKPVNTRSPVVWLGVLTGPLVFGLAAEARDLTGAWVTNASTCQQVFRGGAGNRSFAKDADVYGSGFIYEKNRLRGKIATCVIKTQKEDGDVLHLMTSCSTDVALATVQFSFKIEDDNRITRLFPGLPELETKYFRCSRQT